MQQGALFCDSVEDLEGRAESRRTERTSSCSGNTALCRYPSGLSAGRPMGRSAEEKNLWGGTSCSSSGIHFLKRTVISRLPATKPREDSPTHSLVIALIYTLLTSWLTSYN